MEKIIYHIKSDTRETVEDTPHCCNSANTDGGDFCDSCGDCLICYGDYCYGADRPYHLWVEYRND